MFRRLAALLRHSNKKQAPRRGRLGVEILEDRAVPADASGIVTGTAFLDANGNGVFDAADANVQGISVSLVGTTSQSTAINVTAVSDLNGNFKIDNILPGTYTLSAASSPNIVGAVLLGNLSLPAGVTVTQQTSPITHAGLAPGRISLTQFMTSTTQTDLAYGTAGSGGALGNFRANNAPTVSTALATLNVASNAAVTKFDLAGKFSDPDLTDTSQVTFNFTFAGVPYSITVNLFDKTAPQTVANFFDYVNSGAFNSSIISRLVAGFALQGGAMQVDATGKILTQIDNNGNKVPNEFNKSNLEGTLAMAKVDGDLDSATSQFFFNLDDNNTGLNNLDAADKKFTVFGEADAASKIKLAQLATAVGANKKDFSATATAAANPQVDFKDVPMSGFPSGGAFPTDATLENYLLINSIVVNRRDEFLSYAVEVNVTSGPSNLVVASLDNEFLSLQYPSGGTGAATVKVTATDRYGVSVVQTFTVNVNPGPVSLSQSTVAISPSTVAAGDTATVTLTAKDANGNQLTTGGLSVGFGIGAGVGAGSFSTVTDNGDGTYTSTFTGTSVGDNTITATIGGQQVTSTLPTFTVT